MGFDVVLQTDLNLVDILEISEKCYNFNIPFILSKNFGQIGIIRLSLPSNGHLVLDSHAEHSLPDLRLDSPRKEYLELVDSYDLDSMKSAELSHVPFPILLSKCWCDDFDKKQVRENLKILQDRLSNKENKLDYINFEEAFNSINKYVQ